MAYPARTMTELLENQQRGVIALAIIEPRERVFGWTATPGRTDVYQATIEQYPDVHSFRDVTAVSHTPGTSATRTELTARTSVADVESNPGSFYFDAAASVCYLSLAGGASPDCSFVMIAFSVHVSTGGAVAGRAFVDTDGNTFYPDVLSIPASSKATSDAFFGTMITGTGRLVLANDRAKLNDLWARYTWPGASVRILLGGDELPYSECVTLFTGKVQDRELIDPQLTLELRDANEDLSLQFPATKFTAEDATLSSTFTNGVTGAALTKSAAAVESACATTRIPIGQPKPEAIGVISGISPTVIAQDPAHYTVMYQVAGHAIYSITAVTVGGKTAGFQWYHDLTNGRLLIVGTSSCDPTSAAVYVSLEGALGDDGIPLDNFADIVEYLMDRAGVTTALHQASLDRSRFLCSYYAPSLYVRSGTLNDALSTIMRSCLGQLFIDNDGLYRFVVFAPSTEDEEDLQEEDGGFLDIASRSDDSRVYSRIYVQYGYDESRGSSQYLSCEVARPEAVVINRVAEHTVERTALADEDSAWILGNRYARISCQSATVITVKSSMKLLRTELAGRLKVSREMLPKAAGECVHARVISANRVLAEEGAFVDLVLDDQRVVGTQGYLAADASLLWSVATDEERETQGFWTYYSGLIEAGQPASWGRSRWF